MKNKILKIVLMVIILLLSSLIIYLAIFHRTQLSERISTIFKQQEEIIGDNFSYKLYSNTSSQLELLVTVQREAGIDIVEYGNEDNIMTLDCKGKQEVNIDLQIDTNKEYTFKISSNGIQDIETVSIDENYLEGYINFTELEEQIVIQFRNPSDTHVKYYYRLGEYGKWIESSENEAVPITFYTINNMRINETDGKIYAKQVDPYGNEIVSSKIYNIDSIYQYHNEEIDVFTLLETSNRNINTFGFSYTQSGCHKTSFESRNLMAGRDTHYYGSYNATFTLTANDINNINFLTTKNDMSLYIGSLLSGGNENNSHAQLKITVYYEDGTSNVLQGDRISNNGYELIPEEIDLGRTPINRIEFYMSGYSEVYTSSSVWIRDLVLKPTVYVEKPEIEIKNIRGNKFTIEVTNEYEEGFITEYRYYVGGVLKSSGTTAKEFTVTQLADDTTYSNVYVRAYVGAKRVESDRITVTTIPVWDELSQIAKMISDNDDTITSDTQEVTMQLDGEDYTLTVGEVFAVKVSGVAKRVRIMGFNHDKLTDTAAYGGENTYAGISFEFIENLGNLRMKEKSQSNAGGWASTDLRSRLNNTTINSLSNATQIKQVQKSYIRTHNNANSVTISNDKLWLLSCSEVWGHRAEAKTTEGAQYKYYRTSGADRRKGVTKWWLRSPDDYYDYYFVCVYNGSPHANYDTAPMSKCYVMPGFAI